MVWRAIPEEDGVVMTRVAKVMVRKMRVEDRILFVEVEVVEGTE
jgi:hypothetical protein